MCFAILPEKVLVFIVSAHCTYIFKYSLCCIVLRNGSEDLDINKFAVEYFKNEIKQRALEMEERANEEGGDLLDDN
jgi:hypothetical protein